MVHKYPFTALNLTIEPELLDVNVHPTKMEVRFKNGEELFAAFMEAIKEALTSHTHVRKVSLDKKESIMDRAPVQERGAEPFEKSRMPVKPVESIRKPVEPVSKPMFPAKDIVQAEKPRMQRPVKPMEEMLKEESRYEVDKLFEQKPKSETVKKELPWTEPKKQEEVKTVSPTFKEKAALDAVLKPVQPEEPVQTIKPEQLTFLEDDIHTEATRQEFRIIGQLFDTYWLLQKNDELLVMDQHAAHEKVLYEKLLKAYREQEVYKQQLMPPVVINLTLKELDFVKTYESMFEDFGFTLEEFGTDAYCLRTIPSNLFGMDAQVFFRELLDAMEEEVRKFTLDMVIDKIATMACKAAIKANQKLNIREAEELLKECEKLENPYTCPHGRPIIISISKKEIEKKFKRIV